MVVFGLGFLIAIMGHVVKVKAMVALGVGLVMVATIVAPLLFALTH